MTVKISPNGIKNDIFKGLLKNVQDGISRPQGSREIHKTKVETVLVDTLYYQYDQYTDLM